MAKVGRPLGRRDSRPRRKKSETIGSESSRILQRRLGIKAAGGGMSASEQRTLTPHALGEFEREQLARVKRLLGQSTRRIQAEHRRVDRDNERASRHEAITSFEVEVRGSCGSDVHLRES